MSDIMMKSLWTMAAVLAVAGAVALGAFEVSRHHQPQATEKISVIVQAGNMAAAATAVRQAGGELTHELGVINAVGARLTVAQAGAIRRAGSVKLYADKTLRTAGPR